MERLVYRFQLDCNHMGIQRTIQGIQSGETLARECVIGLVHGSTPIELPTDGSVVASMYVTKGEMTGIKTCSLDVANSTVTYVFDQEDVADPGIVTMQLKLIKTGLGGAELVLVSPKFELEIEQSDLDESEAEDSPTFTALESALAQAQAVYNSRIVSVTTDSSYNLVITYADGTTYESDAIVNAAYAAALAAIQNYITQIEGYVDAAQTAARNASTSEGNAATSETHASQYESHAADHAEDAEAWAKGTINNVPIPSTHPAYDNHAKHYADAAGDSAQDAYNDMYTAKGYSEDAEAWAKGTINNVPVPPTHPAYNNNSKSYKDQAEAIVGGDGFVKYAAQTKTAAEKAVARNNIGAISAKDVPIATASVAGKVKPDGTSIRIDANGTISDYGNRMTEDSEWETVDYIEDFTNGWHRIYDGQPMAQDLYDWLPVTQTEISNGDAWLYIVKETPADTCQLHAEFVYESYNDGSMRMWVLPNFCYDDAEPTASDWIEIKAVPIATTSTVGVVKPDGVSIKVDANGKIEDYGNTFIEGTDYTGVTNIHEFSNGWHKIGSNSSHLNYSQLPLTSTEIGQQEACYLHIVGGYAYGSPSASSGFWYYSAEFVATTDSQTMRKWILPLWYRDGSALAPSASDWVEVDNVLHKPSSQYVSRTLPMWGSGEIISAGMSVDDLLTTSNSAKVVISSTAPSDTTALWVK